MSEQLATDERGCNTDQNKSVLSVFYPCSSVACFRLACCTVFGLCYDCEVRFSRQNSGGGLMPPGLPIHRRRGAHAESRSHAFLAHSSRFMHGSVARRG